MFRRMLGIHFYSHGGARPNSLIGACLTSQFLMLASTGLVYGRELSKYRGGCIYICNLESL